MTPMENAHSIKKLEEACEKIEGGIIVAKKLLLKIEGLIERLETKEINRVTFDEKLKELESCILKVFVWKFGQAGAKCNLLRKDLKIPDNVQYLKIDRQRKLFPTNKKTQP